MAGAMLSWLSGSAAFWGFLGAFMYAGPRLVAGVFTNRARGAGIGQPVAEFLVAMFVGTVAAEAFSPWALEYLKRSSRSDLQGVAVMVGLMSNPAAPRLVDGITGGLLSRISKGASGE